MKLSRKERRRIIGTIARLFNEPSKVAMISDEHLYSLWLKVDIAIHELDIEA